MAAEVAPPPSIPPSTPPPPDTSPVDFIIGCALAVLAGALVALSMVINRYSLAHATAQRIRCIPFVVQPWMVWILAMVVYNIGATGLASIAQLFVPLSLFACLFVTLLVVNLFLAWWMLGEQVTPPRVAGALTILTGAAMSAVGTPTDRVQLQDEYPCRDGLPCVSDHVADLAQAPAAVALYTSLAAITIVSVIAITVMECKYPAADLKRAISHEHHLYGLQTPATRHECAPPGSPTTTGSSLETQSTSPDLTASPTLEAGNGVASRSSRRRLSECLVRWMAYILCTEVSKSASKNGTEVRVSVCRYPVPCIVCLVPCAHILCTDVLLRAALSYLPPLAACGKVNLSSHPSPVTLGPRPEPKQSRLREKCC